MRAPGFALRLAALATALVIGPATLAPGTAEAPIASARASDGVTAAQRYGWGVMQWDFAWEFGESLDSRPYRGADIKSGRWVEHTDGTGRVVKYGGGIEFHSGDSRFKQVGPDSGTTMLTMREQPAKVGRWEIRERSDRSETGKPNYRFVIELVPDDLTADACRQNILIAEVRPGDDSLRIGASAGATRWTKTFQGYPQRNDNYAFGLQIKGGRITWFANGKAIASLGAKAALPPGPMTLRMRLVGDGAKEMNKSIVKVDWARGYDLTRGNRVPSGASLNQGRNRC